MATSTVIPVSEYLKTLYRPDCDYVDGTIEERNLGEIDHSELQGQFLKMLWAADGGRSFRVNLELRVQVSPTRFRVPDVCVRLISAPREQVVHTPPLLCIEILSPEDTLPGMRSRVQDFFEMGVADVWIVDANRRAVVLCTASAMTEQGAGEVTIPGTPIRLDIAEIFSVLDQA